MDQWFIRLGMSILRGGEERRGAIAAALVGVGSQFAQDFHHAKVTTCHNEMSTGSDKLARPVFLSPPCAAIYKAVRDKSFTGA